jgi:hypothetical protein
LSEHKEAKCTIVNFHNCRIAILGREGLALDIANQSTAFLERIAMFRNAEIDPVYNKRGEGKCTFVAGEVNKFLSKDKSVAHSRAISASNRPGVFQRVGYGHHVINLAITNGGLYLALDFTAKYDLAEERGGCDILMLVADTENKLMSELQNFYRMGKWS